MAPRTRATAAAPAASLASAPRRRVKVTPLEQETTVEEEPKPATRATRSKKTDTTEDKAVSKKTARTSVKTSTNSTTTAPATTKTRGRPKKTETITEESRSEPESLKPAEEATQKPKRASRPTRATATTTSSAAKEKPAAKTTRTTKVAGRDKLVEKTAPALEPESEPAPRPKAPTKKKVTFQDIIEDDKENVPVTTRGTRKTATAKPTKTTSKTTGLKAKPVRKPTTALARTATRTSKRTKADTSDDEEDDQPKKIQRILTPKKITQVAKAATPDDQSEDELNGGKTPMKDLSVSPRRPTTNATAEAVAQRLSPTKKIDFSHSLMQQSVGEVTNTLNPTMMSPARRPPTSPAKLFAQLTVASPAKVLKDSANPLASPARRPVDAPAKLLFPTTTKNEQHGHLMQSSNNLFQSPKRSTAFDPARMFAHSAIKPQKSELSKSSFFSSPAKRTAIFSPAKNSTTSRTNMGVLEEQQSPDELTLNDMEVTELMNDAVHEINVSSHQRVSVSPMRPYRLSEDELQMDFDDSVLPVRSPLKIRRSPVKTTVEEPAVPPHSANTEVDEDANEAPSSAVSTPRTTAEKESNFVNLQALETDGSSTIEQLHADLDITETEDDTTLLQEVEEDMFANTPRSAALSVDHYDTSIDELAPSPREDVIAKFTKTPDTPATLQEHELTNMVSSPHAPSSPSAYRATSPDSGAHSPTSLDDNEPTITLGTPEVTSTPAKSVNETNSSPADPAEGESTPKATTSPASLEEHETTMLAAASTPTSTVGAASVADHHPSAATDATPVPVTSPAGLAEHELTMMGSVTPVQAQTPKIADHERTLMAEASLSQDHVERAEATPIAATAPVVAFTPDLPIPRKFNLHTVVSKVPLKPEAEESPFKLQIKKRKRPLSLDGQAGSGGQTPTFTPVKSQRIVSSPEATSSRRTPAATTPAQATSSKTPVSKLSTVKTGRRVTSTPLSTMRAPLTPLVDVSTATVLNGVVAYVDVRTSEGADASAIYVDLLISLGASVTKSWSDRITHVIFKDGSQKILDKVLLSKSDIKIVGVSWPLDCDAQKTLLDEADYLIDMSATEHLLNSVTKSARRRTMEPSMLVSDGSGSVKRSRSKARASLSALGARRSSIKPLALQTAAADIETSDASPLEAEPVASTPRLTTAKKQAALEKNSLTAAWKSINAPQNLGEDTPARRTLDLLQKSYSLDQSDWDSTILSNESNDEDQENTPQPPSRHESDDESIIETGLTPAPYKVAPQIGSAPGKINGVGFLTYRERVEEMERREMRDNAFGTNKGARGLGKARSKEGNKGKRMTTFGFESAI